MKVTVHAEGSAKEIAAQLIEHAAVYSGKAPAAPAAAPAGKSGKGKKAAEEEEEFDLTDSESEAEKENETEEEPEEEEEQEESESDEPESEEEEEAPATSLSDVITAFQKYAKKNSREDAAKVLKKFKVKSVKDLDKKQYADVLKALKK